MKNHPKISLVVIGRNDSISLGKIYNVEYLKEISPYFTEMIYVDSASFDDSSKIMQELGFRSFAIKRSEFCTASAGRNVGTLVANGEFVLYLDSDMRLEKPEGFLKLAISAIEEKECSGIVGTIKDVYPDLGERVRLRRVKKDGIASSFGGGVLLRRTSVLSSGNWNFRLAANEELDLQIRLEQRGDRILFLPGLVILHYTKQPSRVHELMNLYIPGKSTRYGSWGKLLAQQSGWRCRVSILLRNREAVFLVAVVGLLMHSFCAGLIAFVCYEIDLLRRRSFLYNAVVPGIVFSMVVGLFLPRNRSAKVEYEAV